MLTKFFGTSPFASAGDKAAIPIPVQGSGAVSYTQGYGPDYALDPTISSSAILVERNFFNQLMFDVTSSLAALQTDFPQFVTASDNGGSSFAYNVGAVVRNLSDGLLYENLVAANTASPPGTGWVLFLSNYALASALAAEIARAEAAEASLAPKASPALSGVPTSPTAAPGTNTSQLATTAFVASAVAAEVARAEAAEALLAPLASPNFNGSPAIGGQAIATQAFASALVSAETTRAEVAEALLAPLASPALSGVPTTPTPPGGSDDLTIPNTSWVRALITSAFTAGVPGAFSFGGFIIQWGIGPNDPPDTSEAFHNLPWVNPFPNECFVAFVSMDLQAYNTGSDNWYQTIGWDVNGCNYQRQRAQNGTFSETTRGVVVGIGR
jgi:hypothetical protein